MRIHHINILVHDLPDAIGHYQELIGEPPERVVALPARGVLTARFRLGESWLVLVQPTDPDSVPGRHLDRYGEGLFLLSLGIESLPAAEARLGEQRFAGPRRHGLDDWLVRDLDPAMTHGAQLQFTEAPQP